MVISGLDEGLLYVTFDIIREPVIEVKEFGAGARRMRSGQQAAGSKINSNKDQICKISLLVNWAKNE
jgi:hypothetical protein